MKSGGYLPRRFAARVFFFSLCGENLNFVTITGHKSVLEYHTRSVCIPDHELRNLDKGWRLICKCFVFVSCKG